jgi:hypothetical protein
MATLHSKTQQEITKLTKSNDLTFSVKKESGQHLIEICKKGKVIAEARNGNLLMAMAQGKAKLEEFLKTK